MAFALLPNKTKHYLSDGTAFCGLRDATAGYSGTAGY